MSTLMASLLTLFLVSPAFAQQSTRARSQTAAPAEEMGKRVKLTPEQMKELAKGRPIPLTEEQMETVRGEGWAAVLAFGWAAVGAGLTLGELWQMHHRGHGHRTESHIHYWNGVPYVHFHHWD
ncbi:MAG: hypothetical protein M3416_00575 [Acidobacteriota bacterium]|nr:hypothetical protein [Acidobacteriota bacterium]